MKKIIFLSILGMLMLQGCKTSGTSVTASAAPTAVPQAITPAVEAKKEVKQIEMDPLKIMTNPNIGNCTACHALPNKPEIVAGDIGPPFTDMKHRFPDFARLVAAINDQRATTYQTIMPPFGRNKILTPEQIDAVAKYIYQY